MSTNRTVSTPAEDRTIKAAAETRSIHTNAENRIVTAPAEGEACIGTIATRHMERWENMP